MMAPSRPGRLKHDCQKIFQSQLRGFFVCSVTNAALGLDAGPHVEGGKRQIFEDNNRLFMFCSKYIDEDFFFYDKNSSDVL